MNSISAAEDQPEDWLQVDPRSVLAGRLVGALTSLVLLVVVAVVLGIIQFSRQRIDLSSGIAVGIFLLFAICLLSGNYYLPALHYRHLRYRLGPLGFEIRSGILWRKRITVPLSRVQHTDVAQGPLERRFSLSKLVVYTAGTEHASIQLAGLEFTVANRMRDSLVSSREPTDGV
ncbi:PH domain-containing protein [Planctomycetaceae bacterium SH139]